MVISKRFFLKSFIFGSVSNFVLRLLLLDVGNAKASSTITDSNQSKINPKLIRKYSLEDFGASGDGFTDDTDAVIEAFSSGIPIFQDKPGNYRLTRSVNLPNNQYFFKGAGIGKSIFLLDHFHDGFRFGNAKSSDTKLSLTLNDFSLKRLNIAAYTGKAGPKGIYISNGNPVNVGYVEEAYGIGFGIHIDYSENVKVHRCIVRDHKGGMNGLSGTDGIHFYRSRKIIASENIIYNVGDDAISSGSFDINYPVNDVKYIDNIIKCCKGCLKLYSYASDVLIMNNSVISSREGGVYLTDDHNSPDESLIKNICITNNKFSFIGSKINRLEGAALRMRFWPKKNSKSIIENIVFSNNEITNSNLCVSTVSYSENKRFKNITIDSNIFSLNDSKTQVLPYIIRIVQCDGFLKIINNKFESVAYKPILLDTKFNNLQAVNSRLAISIDNNVLTKNSSIITKRKNQILDNTNFDSLSFDFK